ncbi:MAG: hypothetical protein JSR54_15850, partial [Proteobacteria bacterium]|nr:hypothetical protein [Pseudomonadota bacterium]
LAYLVYGAGPDALPELVHALPGLAPAEQACVRRLLAVRYARLAGDPPLPWYAWSWRGTAARAALAGLDLTAPPSGDADAGC